MDIPEIPENFPEDDPNAWLEKFIIEALQTGEVPNDATDEQAEAIQMILDGMVDLANASGIDADEVFFNIQVSDTPPDEQGSSLLDKGFRTVSQAQEYITQAQQYLAGAHALIMGAATVFNRYGLSKDITKVVDIQQLQNELHKAIRASMTANVLTEQFFVQSKIAAQWKLRPDQNDIPGS